MNTTQHKTKKASASQRIPQNFAIGAKVEDIYTGKVSTVSKIYWQNYAGGNTADYTVEFVEGGWNKSQNLKASAAPESGGRCDTCGSRILPGRMAHHKTWCNSENIKAQGKPELPSDDDGKLSRSEWRKLALSRYERMEQYRNHAEALAEALRELRDAYQKMFDVMPVAWQTYDDLAEAALAQWEGVR